MKNMTVAVVCMLFSCAQPKQKEEIALPPVPETPVRMVSETIYGKEINDPYRHLEDLKSPEIEDWYRAHSDRARFVLDAISGRKDMIKKMYAFDQRKAARVYSLLITDNNRYFYLKQTPADETGKLFYRDGFEGEES